MAGKTNLIIRLVISIFLLAILHTAATGKTIFVDANAPGPTHDGTNWANGYKYLQDGLAASAIGDEIWVAEGIYTPDSNSTNPNGSGDRTATFQLKNGVAIKGGYAGLGEPDPNDRDINVYETILSGDLNGNDGPNFTNNGENSYHVITGASNATVDGITISGGNANGGSQNYYGAGLYCFNVTSLNLKHCTFSGNIATESGGAMWPKFSSITLEDCDFTANRAQRGGAFCCLQGEMVIIKCTFAENSSSGRPGGGHI